MMSRWILKRTSTIVNTKLFKSLLRENVREVENLYKRRWVDEYSKEKV